MLTLEQIDAILADVDRNINGNGNVTDTDRHNRLVACRAGYSPYDSGVERQSTTTQSFIALLTLARERLTAGTFQSRVHPWMMACFGPEISADKIERNHRFLEEALELVQSTGCTQSEAHQLVDYVYGRDVGEINQEVGGVMVTLAALCLAQGIDMHEGGETELKRIWTKVDKIRAKQAAKPKHSPLPEYVQDGTFQQGIESERKAIVEWLRMMAAGISKDKKHFAPIPVFYADNIERGGHLKQENGNG